MKKRIFITLIAAALTCACLSAFAACKDKDPTAPSTPPTNDSTGGAQTEDQNNIPPNPCPDGHNFVNGACTVCNELEYTFGLAFISNGDGTCHVSGIGTATGPKLRIPPVSPEGWQVVGIGGGAFSHQTGVKSVVIPEGVTTICGSAFSFCSDLTTIHIPNSVTSIGSAAFSSTALKNVVLPKGLTTIADYLFDYCISLTSVDIPDSVTTIGSGAFRCCRSLTNIHIPDNVKSIGHYAFDSCISLASISIPSSVTTIYNSAFEDCTALTNVTISNGVTSIGHTTFSGCSALTSIHFPSSVTYIEGDLFGGCNNLTSITTDPNNPVYYVKNNCLIDRTTKKLVLGCNTSVIPTDGSVTTIGIGAFDGCKQITTIHIPESITSIEEHAFRVCSALTGIHIPNSVTNIGYSAFYECTSLTSVKLSNSLTSIDAFLFGNCTALKSIHIPSSVTSIDRNWREGCTSLASITVDPNNPIYHSAGNCLIETASKTLISGCKSSVIPTDGSVTAIGKRAFESCKQLPCIVIPNCVTTIEEEAFAGCTALTSVTISDSVTVIGYGAFRYCTNLTSISLSNNLTEISRGMFIDCKSLTSIIIPRSVTAIHIDAFRYCKNLINFDYQGTTSEWLSVTKQDRWSRDSSFSLVSCTDGAVRVRDYEGIEIETVMVLCESGSHWRVWGPSKNAEFGLFYALLDEEGRVVHRVRLGNEHREVKFIWRSEEILHIVNGSFSGTSYHRIYNVKTKQLTNLYKAMIAQHGNTFAYLSYDDHKNIEEVCIRNEFDENGLYINYKLSLDSEPAAAWFEDDLSALYIITKDDELITLHIQDGKVTSHTVGKKEVALNSYDDVLEAYKLFAYVQPNPYLFNLYNCEWIQTPDEATKETLKIMYKTLSIHPSAWMEAEVEPQYYQKDINGDGCQELIICYPNNSPLLLFTMYEGKPVLLSANLFSNSSLKISKNGSIFSYLGYPLNDFSQSCYVLLPGDNKLTHVETFSQYRNSVTLMNYYHRLGADEEATLLSEEEYTLAMESSPYFGIPFVSIANDATVLPLLNNNDSRPLPYIPYAKG